LEITEASLEEASKIFVQIITKNREKILSAKQREDLIVISPELKDNIISKTKLEDKKIATELLKNALKNALELGERDAVVSMGDKLIIRIFNQSVQKSCENGAEKRFNGLPPEELESIFVKLSKKINFSEEMKKIAQEALKEELNIERVNNFAFTPQFVKVFQNRIGTYLSSILNEEKFVIDGLVNFIFRKFFDQSLYFVAEHYCSLMIGGNKKAIDFIDFYNGDTISRPDGTKLQKPFFVDPNGVRINKMIILQLGMNYRKGLESYKFFTQKLKGFESQIALLEDEISTLKQDIEKNESELNSAKEKAESSLNELKDLKGKLIELKTNKASKEEIDEVALRVKQLSIEEDGLFKTRKSLEGEVEKLKIRLVNKTKEHEATKRVYDKEKPKSEGVKATYLEQKKRYEDVVTLVGLTISKFRG